MTLLLILLSFITLSPGQEDTWKVILNGKTVLNGKAEDLEKNVIKITAADLKKKKDLTITYSEKTKKPKWERTITVFNDKDAELNKQKGHQFKISNATLQSLLKKYGTLKIYTWSLPTDPKLQQTVRVRRVHLVTLVKSE